MSTTPQEGLLAEVAPHLARIALLAGRADRAALHVRRLGGLTNVNYLIEAADRSARWVLRVPGAGTADYIDRDLEERVARSADAAGVNAAVLFFDAADGLMLTAHVDGAVTMTPSRFEDLGAVARAGDVLRRLHRDAAPVGVAFRLFPMLDEYKALLAAKGAVLPDGYDAAERLADTARAALAAKPSPLRAAHCDPLCENFLDTGERMVLIDYEYAADNDPMWDLGDLSIEAGFDEAHDRALLRSYFGAEPPPDQAARMVGYKALADLLWTLWGQLQHVNGNPAEDFRTYAQGRFDRCRALMATTQFAAALAAI